HKYANAAFDYLWATNQPNPASSSTDVRGWSAWITPKTAIGWEGLVRFDHLEPDDAVPGRKRDRTIAGVAYWFPHQGNVSTALLFDVDNTKSDNFSPAQPTRRLIAVHALLNFGRRQSHEQALVVRRSRCRGPRGRDGRGAEGPNQWRGRDLPGADLHEVVRRVQQASSRRADQLPAARLGRRHPPDHGAHGLLRRQRRPDDAGADAGRARQDPAPADGARRGGADLQHPRRQQ